jgi:hypothetical protein
MGENNNIFYFLFLSFTLFFKKKDIIGDMNLFMSHEG